MASFENQLQPCINIEQSTNQVLALGVPTVLSFSVPLVNNYGLWDIRLGRFIPGLFGTYALMPLLTYTGDVTGAGFTSTLGIYKNNVLYNQYTFNAPPDFTGVPTFFTMTELIKMNGQGDYVDFRVTMGQAVNTVGASTHLVILRVDSNG